MHQFGRFGQLIYTVIVYYFGRISVNRAGRPSSKESCLNIATVVRLQTVHSLIRSGIGIQQTASGTTSSLTCSHVRTSAAVFPPASLSISTTTMVPAGCTRIRTTWPQATLSAGPTSISTGLTGSALQHPVRRSFSLLHCALTWGTVYCNRSCLSVCLLFVCAYVGVCVYVCVCVCMCVCGSVNTITRNCVHPSSPNWVCR